MVEGKKKKSKKNEDEGFAVEILTAKVELDLSMTTADVVNIAHSKTEDALLAARDQGQTAVAKARQEHAALEEKLNKAGQKVADSFKPTKVVVALTKALDAFVEDTKHMIELNEKSTTINIDDRQVLSIFGIWNTPKKNRPGHARPEYRKDVSGKFTTDMDKIVAKMKVAKSQIDDVTAALQSINRQIADLPRFRRRANAALDEAKLRGQIRNTSDVMKVLDGVQSLALPSATASLLLTLE